MKFFLPLVFIAFHFLGWGQHCPFDGAQIGVIKVTSATTGAVIDGLKLSIYLPDGKPLTGYGLHAREDTAVFWQNPSKTTHSGIIDNNHPMAPSTIQFWFAEDHYVFVQGGQYPELTVVIEDLDSLKNGGHFKKQSVAVHQEDWYPLCSGYSGWHHGPEFGFVDGYAPVDVQLTPYLERGDVQGKYVLQPNGMGAERCGFNRLKLKKNGRFKWVDSEWPINAMEIPNTSKSKGVYTINDKGEIELTVQKTKVKAVAIQRSRLLRKLFNYQYTTHKSEYAETLKLQFRSNDQTLLKGNYTGCLFILKKNLKNKQYTTDPIPVLHLSPN